MYRCEAVSLDGFVQQLGVQYVQHGHFFYVTGEIPAKKNPRAVDAKLMERYGVAISRSTRSRQRKTGRASVQYLRYGHFFVLIATEGEHEFLSMETNIRDIRETPIVVGGYSVSYRQGCDRLWHVSVRMAPQEYRVLKERLLEVSTHLSVEDVIRQFDQVKFERYAPVRRQLLNILRAVNRERKLRGLELVPYSSIRLRRRIVRPFEVGEEAAIRRGNLSTGLSAVRGLIKGAYLRVAVISPTRRAETDDRFQPSRLLVHNTE